MAHVNINLQEFCEYYRKSKRITQLLLRGMPSEIGNKGNHVSRKRIKEEVTTITSLPLPSSTKKMCQLPDPHQTSSHELTRVKPMSTKSNLGASLHSPPDSITVTSSSSHTSSQYPHNILASTSESFQFPNEALATSSETASLSPMAGLPPNYTPLQAPQPLTRYPRYSAEQVQTPFLGSACLQSPFPQTGISGIYT